MKRLSRRFWLPVVVVLTAVSIFALTRSLHAASHPMGEGGPAMMHGMTSGHPTMQHEGQGIGGMQGMHADAGPGQNAHGMTSGHPTMQHEGQGIGGMQGMHANAGPTMPGQDAFGAIQEIVGLLEADPDTDWSKIDLEALRQHLIDMNEVTLNAEAAAKPIDGGLEIAVTGSGRTLAAIRRMVPAHAQEIDGLNGWGAASSPLANGVLLTVTSSDPKEVAHIRGLGFAGILVSGHHHQPHHLAMAKGEFPHGQ